MSFNYSSLRQNIDPRQRSNPADMTDPHTKTTGKGMGTQFNQTLVSQETFKSVLPVFIWHQYNANNSKEDVVMLENVSSVGLGQLMIEGVSTGHSGVLAVHFKGSSNDYSLIAKGDHNLPNIPKNSVFIYFSNNGGNQVAQGDFASCPIILWQKRTCTDFKNIDLEVIDLTTGLPVVYTNIYMWLYMQTLTWQ
jgi:hypothetical protein